MGFALVEIFTGLGLIFITGQKTVRDFLVKGIGAALLIIGTYRMAMLFVLLPELQ